MNIKSRILKTVAIIAALGLTSPVWADCNVDLNPPLTGDPVTGATSAYELSGQGNISCADLSMYEITPTTLTFSSDGKQLDLWETSEEADAVLIKPSNGNRCIYNYPTIATSGQLLTPSNNKTISDVKICSDGRTGIAEPVVAEEPMLPTTTAGVGCLGSISDLTLPDGSIVVAESLDGETVAACSSTADSGQAYCEDRCVNPMDRGELTTCLATAGSGMFQDGEFGLNECKPCDTALDLINDGDDSTNPPLHPLDGSANAGLPMEFCWEKTASAYSGPGDLSHPVEPPEYTAGVPRTAGSMLKHTPIRQSETSITWYNYCYKTTVTVNGRDYVVTTCR